MELQAKVTVIYKKDGNKTIATPGEKFSVDATEAKRLIKQGFAESVSGSDIQDAEVVADEEPKAPKKPATKSKK